LEQQRGVSLLIALIRADDGVVGRSIGGNKGKCGQPACQEAEVLSY